MITRAEAKQRIKEVMDNNEPVLTGVSLGSLKPNQKHDVYNIPLDFLVPNVLNDRIAMHIKEYEQEIGRKLDFENSDDIEYVFEKIENINKNENKRTLEDLARKGQEDYAVITSNGIVVSGNRRTTLLRKLSKGEAAKYSRLCDDFNFLKCIVLDDSYTDKDIMKLETITQLGKDKQVDYNRINLYIKVDNLFNAGFNYVQIKECMSQKDERTVKDMHDLYKFMVAFLEDIGKPNHYSILDGLEDQMIKTQSFLKKVENRSYDCDWEYNDNDVANLKQVMNDYMRAHYEGKEYRDVLIGKVNKDKGNGVFTNKKVWDEFLERHNNLIDANEDKLITEDNWKFLGKTQFANILKDSAKKLDDIVADKSIKTFIDEIDSKINSLEALFENRDDVDSGEIEQLKIINKRIYTLYKDFKD